MRRSIIDINRNNAFAFGIWKNGQRVLDLSTVTRVKFSFAGNLIDSNVNPNNFAWKDPAQLDESGKQVIVCQFGNLDIPTGKHGATITVYDTENTSGVVISRSYPIEVINHGGGIPPGVLEEVTLDDIPDGLSYSKVLASTILGGRVLVAGLDGSLDDLADGTTYQRVKAAALTVDGLIFLDAIEDTVQYAKTNASALDASGLVIWEEIIETTLGYKPEDGATVGAIAGVNLRNSLLQLLGDADVITSQGTAAFINGQGALATLDALDISLDDIAEGVIFRRVKSASLTVDGLIQFDLVAGSSYLNFTGGTGTEPTQGQLVTGSVTGHTAQTSGVSIVSGSFAGGDAAGKLFIDNRNGDFSAETVTWTGGSAFSTGFAVDGTWGRIKTSALDNSGLVLLDEVVEGSVYGLLGKTYVTAGRIEVTGASPFTGSIPVTMTDADVTQTIIDGGVITTGGIALSTAGYLRAGKISFADTTSGWWLGDDAGTPKLNIGSATKSLKWDGTDLFVTGRVVAEGNITGALSTRFGTSADGFHVSIGRELNATGLTQADPAADPDGNYTTTGQTHWYSWGGSAWIEVAKVGEKTGLPDPSDRAVIYAAKTGSNQRLIWAETNSTNSTSITGINTLSGAGAGIGVRGIGTSSTGVRGDTANSGGGSFGAAIAGVEGYGDNGASNGLGVLGSGDGYGGRFRGTDKGPIVLEPHVTLSIPTHSALKGTIWVGADGTTWINTDGITAWSQFRYW